ncbi:MAG: glycerol-3-phosphate 1-O-acyltransferase PlsB [Gammaproteobacteria bacterium]|nr:glycerol-3-phosphate 1-O-acyltransferase PlsB [Gammaproteobacteria bacterium]
MDKLNASWASWRQPYLWWLQLLRKIMHLWVKTTVLPQPLSDLHIDPELPVCYVLENHALSSLLILEQVCRQQQLPSPLQPLQLHNHQLPRSHGSLSRFRGVLIRHKELRRSSRMLSALVTGSVVGDAEDVQIVPVTVLVGRAPDQEVSLTKVLFSENWDVGGRIRRFFSLIINGRATMLQFAEPILLSELRSEGLDDQRILRKLTRILRGHFRNTRAAAIGPDRSHRRTLIDSIVARDVVQQAIATYAQKHDVTIEQAEKEALDYAREIAANYSYTMIRASELALRWFWNRIYRGIDVHHFREFQDIASSHEIIYVPCHRSHIDYLLLSFILYERGFVPPHIAAGINLNLPVLGSFLRRGGAFFLRRSFRSQALYTTVFNEYVSTLLAKGVHIEYFIEGTRSRTGRLLPPKVGMLAMTVRAYLQNPERPVMFQPVHIGYEALVEGKSYDHELRGAGKRKESWRDLIMSVISILRRNYGQVNVSFGEPILLTRMLEKHHEDWNQEPLEQQLKQQWLNPVIDDIAWNIMANINAATHVNPVNLLAICLLASRQNALDEQDLRQLLAVYQRLLPQMPYGERVTMTERTPDEIIAYGIELGIIERREHSLGNIIKVQKSQRVLISYFRNNLAHLIAVPSLIASCFLHTQKVSIARLHQICRLVYPLLRRELFLPWPEAQLEKIINHHLLIFQRLGLLRKVQHEQLYQRASGGSKEAWLLRLIAHALLQTLERIYITFAVLGKNGSGKLNRVELEKLCQQSAERLSILHQFESPEFYDRTLFKQLIDQMLEMGLLQRDEENRFVFGDQLDQLNTDAKLILSKEIRHSILQLAPNKQLLEALADNNTQATAIPASSSKSSPPGSDRPQQAEAVNDRQ